MIKIKIDTTVPTKKHPEFQEVVDGIPFQAFGITNDAGFYIKVGADMLSFSGMNLNKPVHIHRDYSPDVQMTDIVYFDAEFILKRRA
jgi:hypothetical protein